MLQVAIAVLIAAAVMLGWRLRKPSAKKTAAATHRRKAGTPAAKTGAKTAGAAATAGSHQFAAVSLRCDDKACRAALSIRDIPILAAEAPVLPLAGCDSQACQCGYVKSEDRRQEPRRLADLGMEATMFGGSEQRFKRRDRRAS